MGDDVNAAKAAAITALGLASDNKYKFTIETSSSVGHVLNEVLETVVEPKLVQPTFVLDYPIEGLWV
ncbi:hypothetical protein AMTR_s00010p00070490 [Amborella trichopoda]|uniref:Uncharacterized protein n=1 Tax=Amborella trichopoda TaxID=13333 RepID=W1NFU1_AMBTC|nr:hypothetical protein AMTR_s00010p00070490 [Amborella trichopoda]